jgi:hypothetical protein
MQIAISKGARKTVVPILGLALMLACNDSDSSARGGLDGLTAQERSELADMLTNLQRDVGFPILVPTYIPRDLHWRPQAEWEGSQIREANLNWFTDPDGSTEPPTGVFLWIEQEQDPDDRICPPCPSDDPSSVEHTTFRDHLAAVREDLDDGAFEQFFWFREDDLNVRLRINWNLEEGSREPGEQVREEMLKIAESMVPVDSY